MINRCASLGRWSALLVVAASIGAPAAVAEARPLRVAVAANFAEPMKVLASRFESASGNPTVVVSGSTGKLYAQIVNGAALDVFFAADAWRPRELEARGLAISGSRFPYALGRLVLWSPDSSIWAVGPEVLGSDAYRRLAIANPRLAPYGRAAVQFLERRNLWDRVAGRLVQGENVAQAFQFVASGGVELGLVALSQVRTLAPERRGTWWMVPAELHEPIEQHAVVLRAGRPVSSFVDFLAGAAARDVIRDYGYEVP